MTESEFLELNRLKKKRMRYRGKTVAFSGINNVEKLLRVNEPETPKHKLWVRFENVEVIP